MMLLFTTFGIAVVSAICPLVNLELYIAGVGAFATRLGVWPVAVAAALGQTIGKLAWYQVGASSMQWAFVEKQMQMPRWQRSFATVKARIDHRPWAGMGIIFASATVGLPPLAIIAVVTGQLRFNRLLFASMTVAGRTLRFGAVLGGSEWLVRALA